jgi:hypothetical protein
MGDDCMMACEIDAFDGGKVGGPDLSEMASTLFAM